MKLPHLAALAACMLFAKPGFATDAPNCNTENYGPWQYELYIDEPTGFAFVKTPCGWHFVRKIERERVAEAIRMSKLTRQTADAESDSPDLTSRTH